MGKYCVKCRKFEKTKVFVLHFTVSDIYMYKGKYIPRYLLCENNLEASAQTPVIQNNLHMYIIGFLNINLVYLLS